jgi:hypothetical protein
MHLEQELLLLLQQEIALIAQSKRQKIGQVMNIEDKCWNFMSKIHELIM